MLSSKYVRHWFREHRQRDSEHRTVLERKMRGRAHVDARVDGEADHGGEREASKGREEAEEVEEERVSSRRL